MKVIKCALIALVLASPLAAIAGAAQAADPSTIAVRVAKDWVCYYDRETYELLYCQWE